VVTTTAGMTLNLSSYDTNLWVKCYNSGSIHGLARRREHDDSDDDVPFAAMFASNPTSPQASFRTLQYAIRDCLAPVQFLATRYPARPGARGAVEQGPLAH
jgi:hypothetical protein